MSGVLKGQTYCALIAVLLTGATYAQMTTTGTIEGTIIDPSGKAFRAPVCRWLANPQKTFVRL